MYLSVGMQQGSQRDVWGPEKKIIKDVQKWRRYINLKSM